MRIFQRHRLNEGGDIGYDTDTIPFDVTKVWDDEGRRWIRADLPGQMCWTPSPAGPQGQLLSSGELIEGHGPLRDTPPAEWSEATEYHGDTCDGEPSLSSNSTGRWTARCTQAGCQFEITGCETRREAGARFFGAVRDIAAGSTVVTPIRHH